MPSRQPSHLGLTVMPEYLQSEGVESVLERVLGRLGANVVVTSPYLAEPTTSDRGGREPPLDAGAGAVRLLDRPLWGERALFLRTEPSFVPDQRLYADSPYAPPAAGALAARQPWVLDDFIAAAKRGGAEIHLQVMAAIPPCYRVQFGGPVPEDMPMLPDGRVLPARVDNNASLAASGVRAYVAAMLADLVARYPEVDGFKFDWPEYPPYHFLSLLADYNPQVEPIAAAAGIDFAAQRRAMREFQNRLSIGDFDAGMFREPLAAAELEARLLAAFPELDAHLRLRTALVTDYARFLRTSLDAAGGAGKQIVLQGFPPPWNRLSGFDPRALEPHADRLAIKFYTMHWPMMLANYATEILAVAPGARGGLADALGAVFYGPEWEARALEEIRYPEPHEAHGVAPETIARKYREAAAGLTRPLIAMAHSYGPEADVASRFAAAWQASSGHVEINRYGYMSDGKIARIAELCAGRGAA